MNQWLLVSPRHLRSIQTIGSRRWTDGCSASVTLLLSGHSGMPGFEFRKSRYVKVTLGSFDQKKQWDSYIMTIYLIPYTTRNCKHCTSPLEAIWARGSLSNSDNYFQSWIVSPCKPQTIIWGFQGFCLGWPHVQHALSAQVCHVKHYPPRPAKYASFETLVRPRGNEMQNLGQKHDTVHACLFKMGETDHNYCTI